jgi:hypothetical protein
MALKDSPSIQGGKTNQPVISKNGVEIGGSELVFESIQSFHALKLKRFA